MSISVTLKQGDLDSKSVANAAVKKLGIKVQSQAKALSPVDTGKLRASIDEVSDVARIESRVGTNTEYAPYVEKDQPFLETALAIVTAGKIPADVKSAANQVIKKNIAKRKTRKIK